MGIKRWAPVWLIAYVPMYFGQEDRVVCTASDLNGCVEYTNIGPSAQFAAALASTILLVIYLIWRIYRHFSNKPVERWPYWIEFWALMFIFSVPRMLVYPFSLDFYTTYLIIGSSPIGAAILISLGVAVKRLFNTSKEALAAHI